MSLADLPSGGMSGDGGPVPAGSEMVRTPAALRRLARAGAFAAPTAGLCPGFLQANLLVLPEQEADAFLRFCVRNPKPCPLLAVSEPGDPRLPSLGVDLDLRTDLPRYRVFHDGVHVETVTDARALWRDDLVAFAIGCSFSFEDALEKAAIPVRHVQAGRNVPMYVSALETAPAPPFGGPLVVTLRALPPADAIRAILLSDRQPLAHGAPVHIGDPAAIGIRDLARPEFGDAPVIEDGDICVFWACGVTPQLALARARVPFAITHDPGHMLVTDRAAEATTADMLHAAR